MPKELPADISGDKEFMEVYDLVKEYTMTSPERVYSLYKAVQYLILNKVDGDFVECGVWKGGSAMVMALACVRHNETNRNLYLFDTFTGMPKPSDQDVDLYGNKAVTEFNKTHIPSTENESNWCRANQEEVIRNIKKTGFPEERIVLVPGMVEETIPLTIPKNIALLRLDTDWYNSTIHELNHLFPIICPGGILIVDDYGHWKGAKAAVDEYLNAYSEKLFINRIDYTGVLIQKNGK